MHAVEILARAAVHQEYGDVADLRAMRHRDHRPASRLHRVRRARRCTSQPVIGIPASASRVERHGPSRSARDRATRVAFFRVDFSSTPSARPMSRARPLRHARATATSCMTNRGPSIPSRADCPRRRSADSGARDLGVQRGSDGNACRSKISMSRQTPDAGTSQRRTRIEHVRPGEAVIGVSDIAGWS